MKKFDLKVRICFSNRFEQDKKAEAKEAAES